MGHGPALLAAASGLGAIAIAIVVGVSGDGAAAGKSTADAVIVAATAAMADGDSDRAVALMPTLAELLADLDCAAAADTAGPRYRRTRATLWAKVRAWRGQGLRRRETRPAAVVAIAAGEAFGDCRARRPVAVQAFEVALEVRGGQDLEVKMSTIQLGGRWFLMSVGELPAHLDRAFQRELAQLAARRRRPSGADLAEAEPPWVEPPIDAGVPVDAAADAAAMPDCAAYVAYADWLQRCDQLPQAARDAVKQGVDVMQQSWADAATDDVRRMFNDACRQGTEALRQAGESMGCGRGP